MVTSAATLTPVTILNTSATTALTSQFVAADKELAVPMICKGYISALIVHGVELIPKLKKRRKKETPRTATSPPVFCASSDRSSLVYDMPMAVISQLKVINGKDLSIM